MANSIAYPTIFQTELDKAYAASAVTGWMGRNARLIKYNGGREVKIPKMTLQGLADYSKSGGYTEGDVTLEYETRSMSRDRGRGFTLDAMDVNESNFVATAGAVMGEFQRTKVVPETDAYNLSTLYACVAEGSKETYTLAAASVYGKLIDHLAAVRDAVGPSVRLMIHISNTALGYLSKSTEYSRSVGVTDLGSGDIKTQYKAIDTNPLIPTSGSLMKTAFDFWAGAADTHTGSSGSEVYTDKKAGGFEPKSDAKAIHWLIVPEDAPIAVCKQDLVRTFTPETWQKSNAWHVDYRRYFDLWVADNKKAGLYACIGA